MLQRGKIWFLVGGAILLLARLVSPSRQEGPIYGGRHLSEWVEFAGDPGTDFIDPDATFQEAGTHALPWLLKWIQFEDNGWRHLLLSPLHSVASDYRFTRFLNRLATSRREFRASGAMWTLEKFGTNASPELVANLVTLMNNPAAPHTATRATQILAHIDPQGLSALAAVLQNPQHPMRRLALMSLTFSPYKTPSTDIFLPAVVLCLDPTNAQDIVSLAAGVLRHLKADSPAVLPALTNLLSDPNAVMRDAAGKTIRAITAARAANPPAQ